MTGSLASAAGHSPCSSVGGPGKRDRNAALVLERDAGRRPGQPEHGRPLRNARLLAHARLEVVVDAADVAGIAPADEVDRPHQPSVELEPAPGRLGQQLDRSVVMGRAEPARDHAEVGAQPLGDRRLEQLRIVTDDGDAPTDDAEPCQLASQENAVLVGQLAAYELAAAYDERSFRTTGSSCGLGHEPDATRAGTCVPWE